MKNRKIVEYRILSSYYYDELESEVNSAIKDGWFPYKDLKVTPCEGRYGDTLKDTYTYVYTK